MVKDYAGAIIQRSDDTKFLLQLRDNKKSINNPNRWGIFGGGIEKGEKPLAALQRELWEELQLKVDGKRLKLLRKAYFHGNKNYIYLIYLSGKELSKIKLMEGQRFDYFSRWQIVFGGRVLFSVRLIFLLLDFNL